MTRLLLLARACLLGVMCAPAALTAAPPTGLMTDLMSTPTGCGSTAILRR